MTADELVREMLIEVGETTMHKYARFLQYLISGLRDFNLDVSGVPKAVLLTLNDNNTVDLPSDYIAFIRIGICGDDGNLHHLGHNPKMCRLVTDECGDLEQVSGTGESSFSDIEGGHIRNDESIGRYFGVGGGNNQNGYYNIRSREGYIELQNFTGTTIWLEYLADIERNEEGEFEIHPYLVEVLKDWIQWKVIQRNIRMPANAKIIAKKDYSDSRNIAKRRFTSFTPEQAREVIRKTFTQSAKY